MAYDSSQKYSKILMSPTAHPHPKKTLSVGTAQCTVLVMKRAGLMVVKTFSVQHNVQNLGMKKGQGLWLLNFLSIFTV